MSAPLSPGPFAEPWEAQVFAMVVALQERGVFTADDWARALSSAIRPAGGPEQAADYALWLAALEALLAERGMTEADGVEARQAAYLRAAAAAPHGRPILLENDPLGEKRTAVIASASEAIQGTATPDDEGWIASLRSQ